VKEAKVLVIEINKEKELVAYVVAEEESVVASLKKSLEKELPAHMIPAYFIFLDQMPLNFHHQRRRRGRVGLQRALWRMHTPPHLYQTGP